MANQEVPMDFPPEEYEARVKAAQAKMKELDLDCLLLSQFENVYYISGYITWLIRTSKHRPSLTLVPADGDPILIIPELERPSAELFSWLDDIRSWSSDYVDLWVDTLKNLGVAEGRVAAELGEEANLGMPILDWNDLQSKVPKVEWIDAQPMLYELRMIKSDREAEYMREAARIAGEACDAAWNLLSYARRNGKRITERDIAAVMGARMMEEGALIPGFINVRSGAEQGMMHNKYSTDRAIRDGDWIAMDYGAVYRNYNSDLIRVGCFGKPPDQWEKYHEIELDIVRKIEAATRPGVTVKELCQIKADAVATHGFEMPWPGIGHSIGLNIHELPRINPDVDQVLEAGMCFTNEPGLNIEGNTFCVENDLLVVEDGCEVLTSYPAELFIA